jgi:hypothetical protein
VVRARIVLAAADSQQNIHIAGRLGVAVNTVFHPRTSKKEHLGVLSADRATPAAGPLLATLLDAGGGELVATAGAGGGRRCQGCRVASTPLDN